MNDFKTIEIFDPKETAIEDDIFYFFGTRFPGTLGRERAMHVSSLRLDNEARGAKFDSRWVMETYGRKNHHIF